MGNERPDLEVFCLNVNEAARLTGLAPGEDGSFIKMNTLRDLINVERVIPGPVRLGKGQGPGRPSNYAASLERAVLVLRLKKEYGLSRNSLVRLFLWLQAKIEGEKSDIPEEKLIKDLVDEAKRLKRQIYNGFVYLNKQIAAKKSWVDMEKAINFICEKYNLPSDLPFCLALCQKSLPYSPCPVASIGRLGIFEILTRSLVVGKIEEHLPAGCHLSSKGNNHILSLFVGLLSKLGNDFDDAFSEDFARYFLSNFQAKTRSLSLEEAKKAVFLIVGVVGWQLIIIHLMAPSFASRGEPGYGVFWQGGGSGY